MGEVYYSSLMIWLMDNDIFSDFRIDIALIFHSQLFVCILMFILSLFLPRINKAVKYILLVSFPFLCFMSFYIAIWGNEGTLQFCRNTIEYMEHEEACFKSLGLPCGITIRSSCNPNDTTFNSYWDNICWAGYDTIQREKLNKEIPDYCYVKYDDLVTRCTDGEYFVVKSVVNGNAILLRRDFINNIFGEDIYKEAINYYKNGSGSANSSLQYTPMRHLVFIHLSTND